MKTIRVIVTDEDGMTVGLLEGKIGEGAAAGWKSEQGEAQALMEMKAFLKKVAEGGKSL